MWPKGKFQHFSNASKLLNASQCVYYYNVIYLFYYFFNTYF